MYSTILNELKQTHERESRIIEDLDNLEYKLNSLLNVQRTCLLYDPTCLCNTLRIHIYNKFSEQDQKPMNYLFTHVPPSMYTLYIKAYELDQNKNVIESPDSPVLSKYFRMILFDTPSGVLLWDRDQVELQKRHFISTRNVPKKTMQMPDNLLVRNTENGNLSFDQNGCDELHINRLGHSDCDVNIYFFPSQLAPVFSLSNQLTDFLNKNFDNTIISNAFQQATMSIITRTIWSYAFNKRLFVEFDNCTCISMDNQLKELFNLPYNVNHVKISDLPYLLQSHLYPPRPIRISYKVKSTDNIADNEQIFDFNMESCFYHFPKPTDFSTEFDTQIATLEHEIVELVHLRNFYSLFSQNPHKFITKMMDNKNTQNTKPITNDKLYTDDEYYKEPWIHYAMDNYFEVNQKPVQDFILKLFDNTPLSNFMTNH